MVRGNSAWSKNNRRELKRTMTRFLAIFAIVLLGVGFFTGLKVARPAMVRIGGEFVEESRLYDYQLLSTLGLTEEDRVFFADLEGVAAVEGSMTADLLTRAREQQVVFKTHQLLEEMNQVQLTAGRMPEAPNECLGDDLYFTEEELGTVLPVENEDEDTVFAQEGYTVVGLCNTAQYLNIQRGTTSLANGVVAGFLYIPAGGYDADFYTELYIRMDSDAQAFTEEYHAEMEEWEKPLSDLLEERGRIRKDEVVEKAQAELDDAWEEYEDGKQELEETRAEVDAEIADAEQELADAEKRLADAKTELADGEETLRQLEEDPYETEQVKDARKQLDDAWAELERGEAEYQANLKAFQEMEPEATAKLLEAEYQLSMAKAQLDDAWKKLEEGAKTFGEAFVKNSRKQLEAAQAEYDAGYAEYLAGKQELENGRAQLAQAEQTLRSGRAELEKAEAEFDDEIQKAIEEAREQLEDGRKELEEGEAELADAKIELEDAKAEAAAEFADAEAELADAEKKLQDAQKQVDALKKPTYYTLDRRSNTGYAAYDNDTAIVDGIAKVFPVFFFLVAALVCSSTMTRMVEEQRTQNGTLKALGYSDGRIMWRYASYAGSAALLGAAAGFFLCSWLFPYVIWHAYKMLYHFGEMKLLLDWGMGALSLFFALVCSVGAACAAVWSDMRQMPAQLMRPKAPKAGKRILLEYITPLWKRMGFLHKVAARNIFRYKKRLVMMVLGVGGCMSLLIAGLGMRDSIAHVADDQFDEITVYDYTIVFNDRQTEEQQAAFRAEEGAALDHCVFVTSVAASGLTEKGSRDVTIIATDDRDITNLLLLHEGERDLGYPEGNGVYISEKLARLAGVSAGDTLTIQTDDNQLVDLPVEAIYDNYVNHFVCMTGAAYEYWFHETPVYKTAYASTSAEDLNQVAATLQGAENVVNVSLSGDFRDMIADTLSSLDAVIVLVVACAVALSLVVSYNLCNINITERVREIATIKVLGFYAKETYAYVFRETFALTCMGVVVGIPLGIWFHGFVLAQVQVDMVSFRVWIAPMSYVLAVVITFVTIVLVEMLLRGKINQIHMAESLKSVE